MKEIIITGRKVARECWILAGCYLFANIVNVIAIACYSTSWREIFTMQGYIVIFSLVIYALVGIIRLIIKLFTRKKK